MVQADQLAPNPAQRMRTQLETFARENQRALQLTGLVAVAGVTGAVGGLLVAKGVAASKGATAANLALAAKGGATAKAGTSSLTTLLAPQSAHSVGAAVTNPATTGASIQGIASLLNNTASTGTALVDKATMLFNSLSTNVLPLTAGVVGGGATGVGVARRQVRKVQVQLDEQVAQTATLQAETAQLQSVITTTESDLNVVRAKLEQQVQQSAPVLTPPVSTSPAPAARVSPSSVPRQERLEQIRGIGRVFAQRLNEAGIYTLTDLAAQTPEALEAIIDKTRAGAMFDPEVWIAEARQRLGGSPQKPPKPKEKSVETVAEIPVATTMLVLERLEAIDGVSPSIAARLNQNGILTYADLAGQNSTHVHSILGETIVASEAEIEEWLAIAGTLRG